MRWEREIPEIKITMVSVIGNEKVKINMITEGTWDKINVWQTRRKYEFEVPPDGIPKKRLNKKKYRYIKSGGISRKLKSTVAA